MPLRNGKYVKEVMDRLMWLYNIGHASASDMAEAFNLSPVAVREWADKLVTAGTLEVKDGQYNVSPMTKL